MAEPETESPDYLAGHVQEALATDPRVQELGLRVSLRGDRLFVAGTVSTPERQAAVAVVAAEVAAGYEVHNETDVAVLTEPDDVEAVS